MIPDTRKDPRAKVLSMTVRYKSATIDEFIEHHSHDVSRGGMFIKTPSPFPPGTLLKFEVRIAEEQKVMQGVGRVVWKREASSAAVDSPSGMGVKFIKLDDDSKGMIGQLVGKRGSEEGAFDAGERTSTPGGPEAPTPAGGTPAVERAVPMRKGTMIGLGAVKRTDAAPKATSPAFFPDSEPAVLPAPEDRTVMRQAAELLRDALREAGGSMDEIGGAGAGAPLVSGPGPEARPEPAAAKAMDAPVEKIPEPAAPRVADKRPETSFSERPLAAKPRPRSERPRDSIPLPKPAASSKSAVWMVLGVLVLGGGIFFLTQGSKPPPEPTLAPEPSAAASLPAVTEPPAPAETATPAPEPSASAVPSAGAVPEETPAAKAAREKAEAEAAKKADADAKKAAADAKKADDLVAKKAAADAKKAEADVKKAADADARNAARATAAARAATVMKAAPAAAAPADSPAAPVPEKPATAAPAPAPKPAAPKAAPPTNKPSESDNPY